MYFALQHRPAAGEFAGWELPATRQEDATRSLAIVVDPERLEQVIWSLLSNALEFTPRNGAVHIALRALHAHVEITVSDTGVGIRADFLSHVFEQFRQADSSTAQFSVLPADAPLSYKQLHHHLLHLKTRDVS